MGSISGCGGSIVARGWCRKHYMRWWKHGDPLAFFLPGPTATLESDLERWWAKVDTASRYVSRPGLTPCWPWIGRRDSRNYGRFDVGPHAVNQSVLAHRWGYQNLVAPIVPDQRVRHFCDYPPCCKPAHWLVGTQADNVRDMFERGRASSRAGEKNGRSVLSAEQVAEIRGRHVEETVSFAQLGREYGVSGRMISYIVKGESWR